jgi:GMP synthase (glutamine-hydrolysing)
MSEPPTTRVLVLRTGQALSRVHAHCGPFFRLFQRGMNDGVPDEERVAVDELDVCCRHPDDDFPTLSRYHAAIVTGSPAYVGDDEPWMRWGARFLEHIVERDLPLLAVCFGHQLAGVAFGADVGKNPRGREMGTIEVRLRDHPSIADDPLLGTLPRTFLAQCTHRDVIRDPGRLPVLGSADHDANHVVRLGPRQWGVQFHPEFDDVTMRLYLEVRRDVLDQEHGPGAGAARIAAVRQTPVGSAMLRRFAGLAREEAMRRGT